MADIQFDGGAPVPANQSDSRRSTTAASPLRKVMIALGGMAFWPGLFALFSGAPACMGFEEPTLRTLEACPDVARALGTPIERSWVGVSCGNAETSDSFGNASWRFPVAGPNGTGTVSVVAERRGGPWLLYTASVETSAGTFEAVSCAQNAGAVVSAAHGVASQSLLATVTTATDAAPATVGSTCTIQIGPAAGRLPCRVVVDCGGRLVYGAGTTGYASCMDDGTGHIVVMDAQPTATGGDPMLTLTTSSGTGMISDTTSAGSWAMTLTFPPN